VTRKVKKEEHCTCRWRENNDASGLSAAITFFVEIISAKYAEFAFD
jgi:hypothetical protein